MMTTELTATERLQLKRDCPAHFFMRVVTATHSAIIAIPKAHAKKDVPGMPGMTVDLLHGATMRIGPAVTSTNRKGKPN